MRLKESFRLICIKYADGLGTSLKEHPGDSVFQLGVPAEQLKQRIQKGGACDLLWLIVSPGEPGKGHNIAASFPGRPDGKLHFHRVYQQLHIIILAKGPDTGSTEF